MDRIRRDTLLGLVFFGTLAFLLWATVNLTDLSVDNVRIRVFFPQAGSAEVGTNVMVLGMKVGKVGTIEVDYDRVDRPVKMTLLLRDEVPIKPGYRISVRDQGVLGGKQVFIDPGRTGEKLPLDSDFVGEVEPNAFEAIGNVTKGEGEVGEKLLQAIEGIRFFFSNMNDENTSVGKLVRTSALHDSLLQATDRLGEILREIQAGRGTIGDLVMNEQTRNNVQDFLASLRSIARKLDEGKDGPLGVLLNDTAAGANLQGILRNLDLLLGDAANEKGIVGLLMRNDELGRKFTNLVANLDTLFASLNNPEAGALGALIANPQTAADIRMTLANLRAATDALTRNDGLLGILINDRDLGVRFRRIMTQVSRALEDAREAAPIGNLIQVLLGAF